ncbi:autotransporter outer membrane beta-barrel domain-containing protein [Stenotrophomonas maltophilia]|nr:autotransporter outer membrane beta-barrel domain-containing protein [Stenotrophomonas maltophilia]
MCYANDSRANPRLPLAQAVLLAITAFAAGSVEAGDLDNQNATVVAGDPAEAWTLVNGSNLIGQNAQMNQIAARSGSTVTLDGGRVTSAAEGENTVSLSGGARFISNGTDFYGGSVSLEGGNSQAHLTGGKITVPAGTAGGPTPTAGVDIVSRVGDRAGYALLDAMQVHVEASNDPTIPASNTGNGVRVMFGSMDLVNGSQIFGENAGAFLWAHDPAGGSADLRIDNSTVKSGKGAAIHVMPLTASDYNILVANNSTLLGGDGNLLLVSSLAGPISSRTDVQFTVDDSRLAGNVHLDPTTATTATLDVTLRNKAQIDGRFINVTSASIDSDSTWLMTGDSNLGHLALGSTGTVALGNASTFNTLAVDSFDGAGGTLLFNTHLGDDSSLTDKLVIAGDANGQANVRVLNAGGAGAKTDRGIELIDIGGASNAQFDLVGRAVGGQYEYFLVKDANGNWYLRSELGGAPDPCLADPTLPECTPVDPVDPVDPIEPPLPILRPETGAYLANQFALDQMLRHTWRDRQGGAAAVDGIRGWARVDATQSRLGAVDDQLELRVDRSRLQLGADVGVFDNGRGRIGVMGTAARSSATSRSDVTGFSARGKVEGGALGVYGNWANDAMYVDASVQRGQFRNRVQGEGLAEERYDSDIWQSSLEAGYRFNTGQIGTTALSLQPELQLVYTDAKTDVHTETNGTVVRAAGNSGLSGRAGLRLQGESRSAAGASVSPYLAANWYRDGAGNGIAFDDEVLRAGIPRNRYELSAGARVEFRSGLSAWGGFGVMRGDSGYREATATLSVAYTW